MIVTDEILKEFKDLNLESKIIDVKDMWDCLYFFIRCEELYNINIFDTEAELIEEEKAKIYQIFEYCEFIKNNKLTDFVIDFISRNQKEIIKVRPEAISLIRENKLKKLFK